jgi:NAD(P)H-dependent FMN reductase
MHFGERVSDNSLIGFSARRMSAQWPAFEFPHEARNHRDMRELKAALADVDGSVFSGPRINGT